MWERLPAAIVLIRGWKPLPQASFLVSWTYRISAKQHYRPFIKNKGCFGSKEDLIYKLAFLILTGVADTGTAGFSEHNVQSRTAMVRQALTK